MCDQPSEHGIDGEANADLFARFESGWHSSHDSIEAFFRNESLNPPGCDQGLIAGLVLREIDLQRRSGQNVNRQEYLARFPNLSGDELDAMISQSKFSVLSDKPLLPPRYKVGECIGKGGIGSVWRVEDNAMQRPLAVKVLLEKYELGTAANLRLEREALLAGSLQHPGIPPVYELGDLATGSKFFTMKLVEGKTLAELLQQRSDVSDNRLYFLGVFRQIAETVGFAHSKGVIHRDLKPQNVMVGEFGEVQIMDWGMAKRLDDSPAKFEDNLDASVLADAKVNSEVNDETQSLSLDSSIRIDSDLRGLTMAGEIMGTPSYMAPEQARGELENLSERTDVFSLGAMLYEILTAQRLHEDIQRAELVQAAASGVDPLHVDAMSSSETDSDLFAICKHCLSTEPKSRPENGQQVAQAITSFLDGVDERLRRTEIDRSASEVRAREERKRRKTFVTMACIVGLVGIVGVAGIAWQWSKANRNLRESLRQNAAREVYFSRSLEAIDKMLTRVGYETLADVPGMEKLRGELLQEALGFYEEFVEVAGESDQVDFELAKVLKLAGNTHSLLGDYVKAEQAYAQSVAILENLTNADPDDQQALLQHASVIALRGKSLHATGSFEQAAESLEKALEELKTGLYQLDADESPSTRVQWLVELATARRTNALIMKSVVGDDAMISELELAIEAFDAIPEDLIDDQSNIQRANSLSTLANHLRTNKQLSISDELSDRAIKIMTEVVARNPDSPAYRNSLVNLLQNRNEILANNGFFEKAASGFEKELTVRKRLVNDFPNLPYLKSDLVRNYSQLGAAMDELGRNPKAIELLEAGIELGEELVNAYPKTIDHLLALSFIYKNTAGVRKNSRNSDQIAQGVIDYARTYELYKQIVELAPENAEFRFAFALTAHNYGLAIVDSFEAPDVESANLQMELLLESESVLASLLEQYPENTDYQYRLAMHQTNRAKAMSHDQPHQAAELLTQAANGFGGLIEQLPESVRFRFQLVRTFDTKALLFLQLGETLKCENELLHAYQAIQKTAEKFGENARMIEYVTISQNRLAHCQKSLGKVRKAETLFRAAQKSRLEFAEADPENERVIRKVASSYRNLAWLFAFWYRGEDQDLDLAAEYALKAVEYDPLDCEHWTCLAYVHFRRNDQVAFEEALSMVESDKGFDQMTRAAIRTINFQACGKLKLAQAEMAVAESLARTADVQDKLEFKLLHPEAFDLLEMARDAMRVE